MINNNFINILPCLQEVRKSGLISKFSETEQEGSTIKNFKLNSLPNQTSHIYNNWWKNGNIWNGTSNVQNTNLNVLLPGDQRQSFRVPKTFITFSEHETPPTKCQNPSNNNGKEWGTLLNFMLNQQVTFSDRNNTFLVVSHHNRIKESFLPIKNRCGDGSKKSGYANCICFRISFNFNDSGYLSPTVEIIHPGFPDKGSLSSNCEYSSCQIGGEYNYCCNNDVNNSIDLSLLKKGIDLVINNCPSERLKRNTLSMLNGSCIYLVRHGNALHNKPINITGCEESNIGCLQYKRTDSVLTPYGMYQAKLLGSHINQCRYRQDFINNNLIIGTSFLLRTQLTALEILNQVSSNGRTILSNNLQMDLDLLKIVSYNRFVKFYKGNILTLENVFIRDEGDNKQGFRLYLNQLGQSQQSGGNKKNQKKKNKDFLIMLVIDDNAKLKNWEKSNLYDLFYIYTGIKNNTNEIEDNSDLFVKIKGNKWDVIIETLKTFSIEKYSYVLFPDNRIKISSESINSLFKISKEYRTDISHPSIRIDKISELDHLNIINKWKKDTYFPNNNKYKKRTLDQNKSLSLIKNIQKYLLSFKTENNNNKLIDKINSKLLKWKSYNVDKDDTWNQWYKNNKNNITKKINELVEYKEFLQKYSSNDKMLIKTNFIPDICPIFNVRFFLNYILKFLNKKTIQNINISHIWSNARGIFNQNSKKIIIDYLPIYLKENFKNIKNKKLKYIHHITNHKERTIYENKRNKIAFLFLTKEDLAYPMIWEKYFSGNEKKYNIYCHPKYPDKINSFLKKSIIPNLTETSWGNISIVKAMSLLLFEAYKNGQNKYFIFRSASCLPVKSFKKLYNYLNLLNDKSIVTLGNNSGQHIKRFEYLKNNEEEDINLKNFYKGETWTVLNRKHVALILSKINNYMHIFRDVYVPEEHVNIIIILLYFGKKSIKDLRFTIVRWSKENNKHPYLFGPILNKNDKKYILDNVNKDTFFIRKFKFEKNNNVEEFILKLLK